MEVDIKIKLSFVLLCAGLLASISPFTAHAASHSFSDIIPPKVVYDDYGSILVNGFDHEIIVTVTDNVGVKQVVLYYRNIGTRNYKPKLMLNPILKDDYTATILASEVPATGIEYYIQAKDFAGNTLLHGLKFTPLRVHVKKRRVASTGN